MSTKIALISIHLLLSVVLCILYSLVLPYSFKRKFFAHSFDLAMYWGISVILCGLMYISEFAVWFHILFPFFFLGNYLKASWRVEKGYTGYSFFWKLVSLGVCSTILSVYYE